MTQFHGKYRGTVVSNDDPLGLGRLQIEVPSVLGTSRLSWAMPCVPFAGEKVGFLALPAKDARIWVEFEGGDPDHPIWVGCFWDDRSHLPEDPFDPAHKVFRTKGATVTLSDADADRGVTITTADGMTVRIGPQKIEIDNGAKATITLQGNTTSINGNALEVT